MGIFQLEYKKLKGVTFYTYTNSYSEAVLIFTTSDKNTVTVRYEWQNEEGEGLTIPTELLDLLTTNNIKFSTVATKIEDHN